MEISSGADILLQYSKAISLATGGAQAVPFGHDANNIKSASAINDIQNLQRMSENTIKEKKETFDAQTQTSTNLKKANYYNERKGQNVDIYV